MIHRPPRKLGRIAQTDGAGDEVHLVQRLPGLLQRPMALKVQGEVEVDASLVAGSRGGRGVASTRYPPDRRDPSLKQGKKIVRWVKKKGCIPSFDLYSLELMRDPKRKGNRPSSSTPPPPRGTTSTAVDERLPASSGQLASHPALLPSTSSPIIRPPRPSRVCRGRPPPSSLRTPPRRSRTPCIVPMPRRRRQRDS